MPKQLQPTQEVVNRIAVDEAVANIRLKFILGCMVGAAFLALTVATIVFRDTILAVSNGVVGLSIMYVVKHYFGSIRKK